MRWLGAALCLLTMAGCTIEDDYVLSGTVKDAVSGKPLKGVAVELVDVDFGVTGPTVVPVRTDADGRFRIPFTVTTGDAKWESQNWKAKLSAEGFETEVVELGPVPVPEDSTPVHIVVRAYVRTADTEPEPIDSVG